MKCLSIKQPWAWLIVTKQLPPDMRKDVENRTWATAYRGPLLIHAGKSFDWEFFYWVEEAKAATVGKMVVEHFGVVFGDTPARSKPTKGEFGGIIGQTSLIDIVDNSPSRWAAPGQKHWLLAASIELPFRPLKGQLGLFKAHYE